MIEFDMYLFISAFTIAIINVLFIPCISTLIYQSKFAKNNGINSVIFLGIFSAINILASKIIAKIIAILINVEYDVYSIPFCFISIIISIISPFVLHFIVTRFDINMRIENERKEK